MAYGTPRSASGWVRNSSVSGRHSYQAMFKAAVTRSNMLDEVAELAFVAAFLRFAGVAVVVAIPLSLERYGIWCIAVYPLSLSLNQGYPSSSRSARRLADVRRVEQRQMTGNMVAIQPARL